MKTLSAIITIVSSLTFAPQAMASEGGGCHFHGSKPATECVVKDCADQRISAWLKEGRPDASWACAKQTLVVVFLHAGNFIAANFKGNRR